MKVKQKSFEEVFKGMDKKKLDIYPYEHRVNFILQAISSGVLNDELAKLGRRKVKEVKLIWFSEDDIGYLDGEKEISLRGNDTIYIKED